MTEKQLVSDLAGVGKQHVDIYHTPAAWLREEDTEGILRVRYDAASLVERGAPQPIDGRSCPFRSCISGCVYWFQAPIAAAPDADADAAAATWIAAQPWAHLANPCPAPNAAAPTAAPPVAWRIWHVRRTGQAIWIGLPVQLGFYIFGLPQAPLPALQAVGIIYMAPAAVAWNAVRPLREDQERTAQLLADSISPTQRGAVALADCAYGKTAVALRALTLMGNCAAGERTPPRALFIVPRKSLFAQTMYAISGKPWTWADTNEPCERSDGEPVGDASCMRRFRCDACGAYTTVDDLTRCGRTEHTCCACVVSQNAPVWVATLPPRPGWLPSARVGTLVGAWCPTKTRRKRTVCPTYTCPSDVDGADIVVASLASLAQCNYPAQLLASFGAAVWDEVHTVKTRVMSAAVGKLPHAANLGFTASPWGELRWLMWALLGPVVAVHRREVARATIVQLHRRITPSTAPVFKMQRRRRRAKHTECAADQALECDESSEQQSREIDYSASVDRLVSSDERNAALLRLLRVHALPRGKTCLLTERVEHAKALRDAVLAWPELPPGSVFALHEASPSAHFSAAVGPSAKLYIGTPTLLGVGWDDPLLTSLVWASPRKSITSVQQAAGRVERECAGKAPPIVFDIDDGGYWSRAAAKRKAWYDAHGYVTTRAHMDDVLEGRVALESSCA